MNKTDPHLATLFASAALALSFSPGAQGATVVLPEVMVTSIDVNPDLSSMHGAQLETRGVLPTFGTMVTTPFTGTWATGDTLEVKFSAPAGKQFTITPSGGATEILAYAHHWDFGALDPGDDTGSNVSIAFEGLTGTMPTDPSPGSGKTAEGRNIRNEVQSVEVASPVSFVSMVLSFEAGGPGGPSKLYPDSLIGFIVATAPDDPSAFTLTNIPEPSRALLLLLGAAGCLCRRSLWRRRMVMRRRCGERSHPATFKASCGAASFKCQGLTADVSIRTKLHPERGVNHPAQSLEKTSTRPLERRHGRRVLALVAIFMACGGFILHPAQGAISVLIQPTADGTGAVWTVNWDNLDGGAPFSTGSFFYSDGSNAGLGPYNTTPSVAHVVWSEFGPGDLFGSAFGNGFMNVFADGFGGVTLLAGSAQAAVAIGPDDDPPGAMDDLLLFGSVLNDPVPTSGSFTIRTSAAAGFSNLYPNTGVFTDASGNATITVTSSPYVIPEPSRALLLLLGAVGVVMKRRRYGERGHPSAFDTARGAASFKFRKLRLTRISADSPPLTLLNKAMKTLIILFVGLLVTAAFTRTAPAVTFQFVTVGSPGAAANAADPLNSGSVPGIGSVGGAYRIATTEVTIGQYTEFLNAVAVTDAHGLYDGGMGTSGNIGNIIQSGSSGSFSYAVQGGDDPNLPVTYVDWYDTLRFANWMHNDQPSTGMQTASTTEDGAYTFTGTTTVGARNGGAEYFLPTENEWYKAVYHQPSGQGGDSDDYWLYPMATNDVPFSDNPASLNTPDDTRAGNFVRDDSTANGYDDGYAVSGSPSYSSSQLYLTPVGAYSTAASFYGVLDGGGNVWEWNETTMGSSRGRRAGGWGSIENALRSTDPSASVPTFENNSIGFRIAATPEPSRALLLLLGAFGVAMRRRRFPSPGVSPGVGPQQVVCCNGLARNATV